LRDELAAISHLQAFRRGEAVQAEAEEVPFIGNVLSGILRIQASIGGERRRIGGLLLPSDFYGRPLTDPSKVKISAASDAIVCCFERDALDKLSARFPELGWEWMDNSLDEIDAARDWATLLDSPSVTALIASFLLMLCRRTDACMVTPTGRLLLSIPISRSDIAACLGTTIETVGRTMLKLSNLNIIRVHKPRHF
jgi:CRP/FNR family transcriptional regulator